MNKKEILIWAAAVFALGMLAFISYSVGRIANTTTNANFSVANYENVSSANVQVLVQAIHSDELVIQNIVNFLNSTSTVK